MSGIEAVSRRLAVVLTVVVALGVLGSAFAKDEGWLGVMLQPLTGNLKDAMNIGKDVEGVLISDVVTDSPADAAGVEKGDIIVEIEGRSISSADQAIEAVKAYAPGDKVKLVVLREGKREVLTAALGSRSAANKEVAENDNGANENNEEYYNVRIPRVERIIKEFRSERGGYLGVRVQDISADLGSYFGVGEGEGVLVVDVTDGSPAGMAGIRDGDVIVKVGAEKITDSAQLVEAVREYKPGDKVDLTLKRNRETKRVEAELGEGPGVSNLFMGEAGGPSPVRTRLILRDGGPREPMGEPMEVVQPCPPGQDVREEIEKMRQEIEQMRDEIDALKKP
jgi:S1-C subfamily serine protease